MGNSGWTNDPTDITIPADAGPEDARIFIGQDDPMITGNNTNGIVFYYRDFAAFIISVIRQDPQGLFSIRHRDTNIPLDRSIFIADYDWTTGISAMALGNSEALLRLIGDTVTLEPNNGFPLLIQLNGGDYTLDGVSQPRGVVSQGGRSSNSAAIGNTETDLFTMTNFTFKAGRAYGLRVAGMHNVSVANNRPLYRLRKSSGGQQLVAKSIPAPVAAAQAQADFLGYFYVTGSDVNCSPVVSVIGSAAFTVLVFNGYGATIEDIGPASLVSGWGQQLT